jgi:hypothetical protein
MKFTVVCGELNAVVDSDTPRAAAEQAFLLWNLKIKKSSLSKVTVVVKPDNKEVYLPTNDLLEVTSA